MYENKYIMKDQWAYKCLIGPDVPWSIQQEMLHQESLLSEASTCSTTWEREM